jgi:DNA modification methylase
VRSKEATSAKKAMTPISPALQPPDGSHIQGLLIHGDNLDLFASLPAGIAQLIATDPPFFTGQRRIGSPRPGKGAAGSASAPKRLPTKGSPPPSFDDRWDDIHSYLSFLRPRLAGMWRLLAPSGSLIVHLDYRMVHEVKIEMDHLFGRDRFINEIIWHYTGGGRAKRYFSRKHDTLLWYAKGRRWTFNTDAVRVPYKSTSGYARGGITSQSGRHYKPHPDGTPVDDVWDIPIVNPLSPERCGFPTQKPERLLQRIILALSNEGDLVIDPFSGSGTTAVAAQRLGRRWIACDRSDAAVAVTRRRLQKEGAAGCFQMRAAKQPLDRLTIARAGPNVQRQCGGS